MAVIKENLAARTGDSSDQSTSRNEMSPSSSLYISSEDDSEICNITADLVPTIDRVNLSDNQGRFHRPCEEYSPILLPESPTAQSGPAVSVPRRRHSSTNMDTECLTVSMIYANTPSRNDTITGNNEPRENKSIDKCEETRTTAVQTCLYTAVTLVNFPLESSVMGTMTPLTLACLQGVPEATLLLLRHGASPIHGFSQTQCYMHDINQPIYATVNQLNLFSNDILTAFRNYKNAMMSGEDENDSAHVKISNYTVSPIFRHGSRAGYHHSVMLNRGSDWLQCLSYMSLVMKVWPPMMTREQTNVHKCPAPGPRLPIQFAEYLPEFCGGTVPAGLQHLCRCTIRDELVQLRRLPEGIHELPLPTSVKHYIDLKQ